MKKWCKWRWKIPVLKLWKIIQLLLMKNNTVFWIVKPCSLVRFSSPSASFLLLACFSILKLEVIYSSERSGLLTNCWALQPMATLQFIVTAVRASEWYCGNKCLLTLFMNKINEAVGIETGYGPDSERSTRAVTCVYDNMMWHIRHDTRNMRYGICGTIYYKIYDTVHDILYDISCDTIYVFYLIYYIIRHLKWCDMIWYLYVMWNDARGVWYCMIRVWHELILYNPL